MSQNSAPQSFSVTNEYILLSLRSIPRSTRCLHVGDEDTVLFIAASVARCVHYICANKFRGSLAVADEMIPMQVTLAADGVRQAAVLQGSDHHKRLFSGHAKRRRAADDIYRGTI
jgi:hypothetical protein